MTVPIPLVYVETNWVIACVISHDDSHQNASGLLAQAARGDCELRIPQVAILESKGAVANTMKRFSEQFTRFGNPIEKAFRNGVADLRELNTAMKSADVLRYMSADLEQERQKLLQNATVHAFSDPIPELMLMDKLNSLVSMGGVDIKDFYILTSILTDRNAPIHATRPAIFFSTNREEFAPGKKIDQDTYKSNRLVWRPDFQLRAGLKDWSTNFP